MNETKSNQTYRKLFLCLPSSVTQSILVLQQFRPRCVTADTQHDLPNIYVSIRLVYHQLIVRHHGNNSNNRKKILLFFSSSLWVFLFVTVAYFAKRLNDGSHQRIATRKYGDNLKEYYVLCRVAVVVVNLLRATAPTQYDWTTETQIL